MKRMNKDIKEIIKEDKDYYYGNPQKHIGRLLTRNPLYRRGQYIIACRKAAYYDRQGTVIGKLLSFYYKRRKNILGEKLHIELGTAEFGRRLRIYHNGIIVNAGAIIGDDCELYGNNCIGNKGSQEEPLAAPIIGNGVSFGVGANAIGHIYIADGCKISGNSFVNKDLTSPNSLYGGVPVAFIKHL